MSRLPAALAASALWVVLATPLRAQNAGSELDRKVQDRLTAHKAATGLGGRRCPLGQADASEIVVCAPRDPDKYRYPGREQLDSVQSTRDGLPRAPDFVPKYPGVVVARGCFIPPCPPPSMIFIDVAALPQAPAGSDADKIAKGEMKQP